MPPYLGLLHRAFTAEPPNLLQGNGSAEQTLTDIEPAYTEAPTEQGIRQQDDPGGGVTAPPDPVGRHEPHHVAPLHPTVVPREGAVHRAGREPVPVRRPRASAGGGRKLRPIRCETMLHVDTAATEAFSAEAPLGRFSGVGTCTDRGHPAFDYFGGAWATTERWSAVGASA
ncbi:MAG: hypothetical protein ACU0CI_11595 [Shimia sp.]